MSKYFDLLWLAVAAIVVCAVAVLLMPAKAASEASSDYAATYAAADDVGYLPAQYVNQAREIEPVRAQF
jgi:hypothetical protein